MDKWWWLNWSPWRWSREERQPVRPYSGSRIRLAVGSSTCISAGASLEQHVGRTNNNCRYAIHFLAFRQT